MIRSEWEEAQLVFWICFSFVMIVITIMIVGVMMEVGAGHSAPAVSGINEERLSNVSRE